MSAVSNDPRLLLAEALRRAAAPVADDVVVPLVPPAQPEHGDLATPVAMALAKKAGRPPREIAEEVAERLRADSAIAGWIDEAEIAGPGFINLRLGAAWFIAMAAHVESEGGDYGRGGAEHPEKVLLEYVSANPTGPPHVGHARHAAYGDSLARLLGFVGHNVTREYYLNDYGRQMQNFGASVAARYAERHGVKLAVPEDGYQGDYVAEIAASIDSEVGDRWVAELSPLSGEALEFFSSRGGELMRETIAAQLERFRTGFDGWFSESSLHEGGLVEKGIDALSSSGDAYEKDDALWFATSNYGDEKDRVLRRSDGDTTYLASDVAYHLDKAARAGDRLITVLGADHHGYIARLKAVLQAGGHDPETLEIPLVQLVSLLEDGEAAKMSKRAGTVVSLSDLIDDIGVDAARFFLVQRSHETPFDLDLRLAREQSRENPVYYVQYAHARTHGILSQLADPEITSDEAPTDLDEAERAVAIRLSEWPAVVSEAADKRAPHRIAAYLMELSGEFHAFYHRCRVKDEPEAVQAFRASLTRAAAAVLAGGLDLLGVDAPTRM